MALAIVTGATGTLGKLVATRIAERGFDLVITGRSKFKLLRLAADLQSKGVRVAPVEVDFSSYNAVDTILSVASSFGEPSILVNCAATQGPIARSWDIPREQFDETFKINFSVPAALASALVASMKARREGWIINISGGGATSPRPMFAAYGAAKTALVRFSENLAAEAEPLGIKVNCISPGAFRSGMTEAISNVAELADAKEGFAARKLLQEDSGAAEKTTDLIEYLVVGDGRSISGRLISAIWDDWSSLHLRQNELGELYTLRRLA